MALYVKVFTSFFSSRKTIRLKALIGADALWVPVRLWIYAAENQADGDFDGYSAEEIAALIQYEGDAKLLLHALQRSGFMDKMAIHNWAERNGYHKSFSERGTKAANARWGNTGNESPPEPDRSPTVAMLAAHDWNALDRPEAFKLLEGYFPGVDILSEYNRFKALREKNGQKPAWKPFFGWLKKASPTIKFKKPAAPKEEIPPMWPEFLKENYPQADSMLPPSVAGKDVIAEFNQWKERRK